MLLKVKRVVGYSIILSGIFIHSSVTNAERRSYHSVSSESLWILPMLLAIVVNH